MRAALTDPQVLIIAVACHTANLLYCRSIGDDSQVPWGNAPEWQRQSAMTGVRFVYDNPDAPPSANHDSWMAEKVADGWVYGEVKDPIAKTHHCIVPFEQLPPAQQFKDVLFRQICQTVFIGMTL